MLFCQECNCEIFSRNAHNRTTKHKENCTVQIDPNVKLVQTGFKNRIITYHLSSNSNLTDVKLYLGDLKEKVLDLLEDLLKTASIISVNMELYGRYLLPSTKEQEIKSFNSRYGTLNENTNLNDFFNDYQNILLTKASDFSEMGSGWALSKLLFLELNINKCKKL